MARQLSFGIFQRLAPGGYVGASWRDPSDRSAQYLDLSYWTEMVRSFEAAKIDFLFLADSYGYPTTADGDVTDAAIREAEGVPGGDPVVLVSALAAVTDHLGFVVTSSTTVERPQANARRFATLDHLTRGRIGWNVVTGASQEAAARLLGIDLIPHDVRYDMAEDYLDLSLRLWEGSWEDDAVVIDRERGVYAEPSKVHRVRHEGPYFRADGILNVEPSPQRTPVLFQAGGSERGRDFAGRNAEALFLSGGDPARVARQVADIRARAVAHGRDRHAIKILVGALFFAAETSSEARAKREAMSTWSTVEAAAATFRSRTGVDLLAMDPDATLEGVTSQLSQSAIDQYNGVHGGAPATVREIIEDRRRNGASGTIFVGTGEEIAAQVQAYIEQTDADGFLVQPHLSPSTYDDFARFVLPTLRERGLARDDYEGTTLRELLFGAGRQRLPADHRGSRFRA